MLINLHEPLIFVFLEPLFLLRWSLALEAAVGSVVVTNDEILRAIEPIHNLLNRLPIQAPIAHAVNCIVVFDRSVPIADKCLIHMINIFERTLRVFDDVMMSEMRVGGEVGVHSFLFSWYLSTHCFIALE